MATESHCVRALLLPACAQHPSGFLHSLPCTSPELWRHTEWSTKHRCDTTNPPLWCAWSLGNKSYTGKIALPFHFFCLYLSIAFNCTVTWLKSLPGGSAVEFHCEVSRSKERGENSSQCFIYFRKTGTSKNVRTVPLSLLWLFKFLLLHQK